MVGAAALARRAIGAAERQTVGLLQTALEESTQATVLQRLADRFAFATGEADLVDAAQATLRRLVASDRGDLLLLNPSRDRLSVGTTWGADAPAEGALVDAKSSECPGIRRGAVYETPELADDLAVRCRAHPAAAGALLCVPMIALGETVGVVHLERAERFRDDEVRQAGRTAEQASLALANARLLRTMENLAMTDSLTGLQNARFFDPLLDQELTRQHATTPAWRCSWSTSTTSSDSTTPTGIRPATRPCAPSPAPFGPLCGSRTQPLGTGARSSP